MIFVTWLATRTATGMVERVDTDMVMVTVMLGPGMELLLVEQQVAEAKSTIELMLVQEEE
jgi:hypothetical protein